MFDISVYSTYLGAYLLREINEPKAEDHYQEFWHTFYMAVMPYDHWSA